jgi:PAS domain S-box-containing protein
MNNENSNNELLSILFEKAPDSIFLCDENGVFIDVNQEIETLFGHSMEYLIGKSFLNIGLFPPEDIPEVIRNLTLGFNGAPASPTEFKIYTKNRTIKFVEVRSHVFTHENQDLMLGVIRDISHQKRYQKSLEGLNHNIYSLATAETIEEIIEITASSITDVLGFQEGSIGFVEGNALVYKYHTNPETTDEFILPLDGPGISVQVIHSGKTVRIGDVRGYSNFVDSLDNKILLSELCVPVKVFDEVVAVLNIENDTLDAFTESDQKLVEILAENLASALSRIKIAEEKNDLERDLVSEKVRVEQERELSRLKTRFMSTATHEIRTPLTSIQGYTEIIQEESESLTETHMQYFDVIKRNVERLSILTDDLLDLQRLEEGKLALTNSVSLSRELVEEVLEEFIPILNARAQTVTCDLIDTSLHVDKLRLMQVIINLLSNASKFSPVGAKIAIRMKVIDDMVQMDVIDPGIGISGDDIGKLFTPFPGILVDNNVRGTGLGLSICKGIVELHGGKIWAESEGISHGSTFSFRIPL